MSHIRVTETTKHTFSREEIVDKLMTFMASRDTFIAGFLAHEDWDKELQAFEVYSNRLADHEMTKKHEKERDARWEQRLRDSE